MDRGYIRSKSGNADFASTETWWTGFPELENLSFSKPRISGVEWGMLFYEQLMRRNPSIERLFRWRFLSHEKTPKSVVPPCSVIRLIRAKPDWDPGLNIGDEFRVGYYRRQDGPNCVWLVDRFGEYVGTWDQGSLLNYFEVVTPSDETDVYGLHRPVLQAL